MVGTEKCPVCGLQCNPRFSYVMWGEPGYVHEGPDGVTCWWTAGAEYQKRKPQRITLWQRIKKHGLKARKF